MDTTSVEQEANVAPDGQSASGLSASADLPTPGGAGVDGYEPAGNALGGLDMVLDVPVTLSMEVGRTRMPIRDLLQLGQGSVLELDRLAGAPMDVLVNGTLIAHGEVVVVNEKFGIRLTDIVSARERVRSLK